LIEREGIGDDSLEAKVGGDGAWKRFFAGSGVDMMKKPNVLNINVVPDEFVDDPQFAGGMKTVFLGAAAGSEKLYVNIDYVKPGEVSAKYHAHSRQEEFFMILGGTGILRLNGEEIPVKQGDFVAKPAGRGIAHQLINNGTEVLQILDCGTPERDEIITYPDEEIVYVKKDRMAFKASDLQKDWTT
jgi:uncharacterized cupin superfamily protein